MEKNKNQKLFGITLGNYLTRAGLSARDISLKTNISPSVIENMIEGEFNKLPQKIFVRNFLLQICEASRIESSELLKIFEHAWSEHETSDKLKTSSLSLRFVLPIALIIVVAASGSIWLANSLNTRLPSPNQTPVQQAGPKDLRDLGPLPYAKATMRSPTPQTLLVAMDEQPQVALVLGDNPTSLVFRQKIEIRPENPAGLILELNGTSVLEDGHPYTKMEAIELLADRPWLQSFK